MKVLVRLIIIIVIIAAIVGIVIYELNKTGSTQDTNTPSAQTAATSASAGLVINEIMAQNKGIFPDETGEYSDWVEIYNPTDQQVSLQNYALTDDEKKINKWPFPNISIKPKGYLVVFLSGKSTQDLDKGIIHSIIKLSSKGDKLILSNAAGQKIDSIDYKSMDANVSYGWAGNERKTFTKPTPGFENTDNGYEAFKKSMMVENSPVVLSEIMTSNNMTLADNKGAYSDWVEITNISTGDVNLKGLGLTDDPSDPLKWRFPDVTIKPGENLIVFCSGDPAASDKDPKKGLHTNFRLASYKETVELTNQRGMVLDKADIKTLDSDTSFARTIADSKAGDWKQTNKPTPGYPNTDAGFDEFQKKNQVALSDIVISEVMPSNNSLDIEQDKATYDFIEITNRGKNAVNLKDYGLTTNAKNPAKFSFPDMTINPGEYKLVLASGLKRADAEKKKYLHAPFKLSMQGETLALFDPKDKLIDKYYIGYMPRNYTMGREEGKNTFSFFSQPTPGAKNGTGAAGFAGDVAFDKQSGVYQGGFDLVLSAAQGSEIYYTVDGGTPTQNSTKYSGPVKVDKTTVIRACAFKSGYIQGRVMTSSYFINDKHSLPVISLTTDDKNLFDPTTGIYMEGPNASQDPAKFKEGANYYKDTEVPASFEVYDAKGKRIFNQDIALRMAGGLGLTKEQKSFAIIARSQYGEGTMKYPFFENRTFKEYKSLILRQVRENTKIKEAALFSLVDGKIKALSQALKPYVVYINGKYWGFYYLMERRNKYMFAQHEGADDPDAMNIIRGTAIRIKGSPDSYKKLIEYVNTHDMSLKESYDYVAARLDTDSFMDVMINQIYVANNDPYNMQAYQIANGKWKHVLVDLELTMYLEDSTLSKRMANTCNSDIFNGLLKNSQWKDKFIERFAWTIKEVYNKARFNEAIDKAAAAVRDEIPNMAKRFSDLATIGNNWEASVKSMHTFADQRPAKMVAQIKQTLNPTEAQIKMLDDAIK